MDRELLLEIGTEEIPASWLPGLTAQIGQALEAKLKEARLSIDEPVQTYSTPRRLIAHAGKIGDRQSDLEELLMGPPVAAAFKDGVLTPAGAGFAKKQGVAEDQIERITTPKGEYIAVRKHQRGKAAIDVLPDVLAGVLRAMSFPKQMRWDATLDDGKGELPFGRPIRWIVYLYGGRVVPFIIGRTAAARDSRVLDISAGANTYGHRFLATSGRAGHAIKVKHFDDFRKRLAENFVVLERGERHDRIARELDAEARRRGGRIASALVGQGILEEVPDLVEYPVVVSGTFADEFLKLPEEVLTTTMIHHQHFFPVNTDQSQLMPVFLAVLNMQPEQPEVIAHNMERVLTARLRDARFFFDADREQPLASSAVPTWLITRPKRDACARPTSRPTWSASSPSCREPWAAFMPAKMAVPKRYGRRFTTTTSRSVSKRPRRRPESNWVPPQSPGRPWPWPTSSTRSPGCLPSASGPQVRAIRTDCVAPRRAWFASWPICRS